MTIFIGVVGLFIGALVGVLSMCLVRVNPTNDTERLDTLQEMGWFTSHIGGRWAVMREVMGEYRLVAPSQGTLREAIDVALGVSTHG